MQRARCGPGARASELAKGDLSASQRERCDLGNGGCADGTLGGGPSPEEQVEELAPGMMKGARFAENRGRGHEGGRSAQRDAADGRGTVPRKSLASDEMRHLVDEESGS